MRRSALLPLFAAACTGGLDVDPPENGMQLKTEPMEVAAGKEVLLCTYMKPLDKELLLKSITFHQTAGGHHVALFSVTTPQPSGTRDCTDPNTPEGAAQMANWRPVAAGTNNWLPAGVALKIPAGKQLMMQSHFVNTGSEPMMGQSAINMEYFEGTPAHVADYLSLNEIQALKLPRGESTVTRDFCTTPYDINIIHLLGHTHQYGTLFRLELEGTDGAWIKLYEETDGKLLRERPPQKTFPPEAPLVVKAGQRWRYTCAWNNDTDHEIRWPEEMCAAFMMYYPSKGFLVCNDGENSTLD